MIVYRVYNSWYDTYSHIGIFFNQINAWKACKEYYDKHLIRKICFEHMDFNKKFENRDFCDCKPHRLRASRYTRFYIKKEEIL